MKATVILAEAEKLARTKTTMPQAAQDHAAARPHSTSQGSPRDLKNQNAEISPLKRRLWKALTWFFGGVLVGLIPIWVEIAEEGSRPSTSSVLQHGDLFVASAVLCAASATDRLGRGIRKYDFLGFLAVGSASITFLGNTVYFTTLDSLTIHSRAVFSLWLFVFAVASSAACVMTGVDE